MAESIFKRLRLPHREYHLSKERVCLPLDKERNSRTEEVIKADQTQLMPLKSAESCFYRPFLFYNRHCSSKDSTSLTITSLVSQAHPLILLDTSQLVMALNDWDPACSVEAANDGWKEKPPCWTTFRNAQREMIPFFFQVQNISRRCSQRLCASSSHIRKSASFSFWWPKLHHSSVYLSAQLHSVGCVTSRQFVR